MASSVSPGDPMRQAILVCIMACVGLAGCTGDDTTTGTLRIEVLDEVSGRPVELAATGAWALTAGDAPHWFSVFENETWQLVGTGQPLGLDGAVPVGSYQGLRIAFASVAQDGRAATLTESGFDLPIAFEVHDDEDTVVEIGFAWSDALFESQQGLAFRPAVNLVRVVHGGEEVLRLDATDIALGAGKPPVARMRLFDATGLEVFESDFVADSRTDTPVIGNAGNLTFAASGSEALQAGAELATYEWDFGDGTGGTGVTVYHEYPLRGGNYTVRLTVTDSLGNQDSQGLFIALRPITEPVEESVQFPVAGTITGVDPLSCGGPDEYPALIPGTYQIGASPARLGRVAGELAAVGLGLPVLLPDLALRVVDAGGEVVGESNGAGAAESFETKYEAGTGPAGGNWTLQVGACLALETAYVGSVTVTWVVDPAYDDRYLRWIDAYDDGHNHQH